MKNLITLSIISISLIIFGGCAGMHYREGITSLKLQEYPEAIDSFNTVLEKNPRYPKAHTRLGTAYYKAEMYEKAISELENAKELQGRDKRARLFLGMAYLKHGKKESAITEWGSYLEMFPSDDVSEQLQNSIAVLKSGEILPETVDLITGSIENIIKQEDKIRDMQYYYNVSGFGYGHRFSRRHGYYPCD